MNMIQDPNRSEDQGSCHPEAQEGDHQAVRKYLFDCGVAFGEGGRVY